MRENDALFGGVYGGDIYMFTSYDRRRSPRGLRTSIEPTMQVRGRKVVGNLTTNYPRRGTQKAAAMLSKPKPPLKLERRPIR